MIGEGTKIDNLVQIAHNVVIGKHCIVCAQAGISGSTRLDKVALAVAALVLGGSVGYCCFDYDIDVEKLLVALAVELVGY